METKKHTDQHNRTYRRALTIAGSDSGGGAGIQADLKSFAALGCYGMSVITALTAQNTTGVSAIHPVPADFVGRQMEAIFSDIGTDAVKIGMLFSSPLIEAVAENLKRHAAANIVLDPVMIAQSGDRLLEDDAVQAIKTHLLPMADVVTPNLPEAAVLLEREIGGLDDMQSAARELARFGCRAVLLKGGHLERYRSTDVLYMAQENRLTVLGGDVVNTRNNHGTGCTLSSAVAAYLAHGMDVETAVRRAKIYIGEAIRAGARYRLGAGHGPVHHFFNVWR